MADNDKTEAAQEEAAAPKKAAAKKPAAKATDKKPAAEKKPATKKPAAKAADEKKPAAKKPATAKAAAEKKPAATTKAAAAKKPAAAKAKAEAPASSEPVLKVHHLRPAPGAKTAKTRVGRGEASKGKTAGRGTKGTKARYQVPERFEGGQMPLHMRLPKLRGFKNPFRTEYQVVNLDTLSALFPKGGTITVEDLVAKGAVRKGKLVKVLGAGEVTAKFDITVDAASASAREKIAAAGGQIQAD